jgi:hypothetical protein
MDDAANPVGILGGVPNLTNTGNGRRASITGLATGKTLRRAINGTIASPSAVRRFRPVRPRTSRSGGRWRPRPTSTLSPRLFNELRLLNRYVTPPLPRRIGLRISLH